jgi:hypothetical protein
VLALNPDQAIAVTTRRIIGSLVLLSAAGLYLFGVGAPDPDDEAPGPEAMAHAPVPSTVSSVARRSPREPHPRQVASGREPGFHQRSDGADWLSSDRSSLRKAVPVTRGQELGLRFRPDARDPIEPRTFSQGGGDANRSRLDPPEDRRFRPMARERKPTYEELQAESRTVPPVPSPATVYPPPPPVYGVSPGYWR